MPSHRNRNVAYALLLGILTVTVSLSMKAESQSETKARNAGSSTEHDFDFLMGRWNVRHRKLKHRLVHSNEWETFPGTCKAWKVLAGQGNVDDNVLETPAGTYRALSLRTFDPKTKQWSIWWSDSRTPQELAPPVIGTFSNGVGTFFGNDTLNGKPIVVRYIWSDITGTSAKWQQAFSEDGGKTWETNWVMEFHRTAPAEKEP